MQAAQLPFAHSHHTPSFPTPFAQGYPPTNSGLPLQPTPRMPQPGQYKPAAPKPTITHPLSYLDIRREPQFVTGSGGRSTYIVYCVHPNTLNNRLFDADGIDDDAGVPDGKRRVKSPGSRPAFGETGEHLRLTLLEAMAKRHTNEQAEGVQLVAVLSCDSISNAIN